MTGQHPYPDENESSSYFSRAQISDATSLVETLWAAEKWFDEIPDEENPGPKVAVGHLLMAWKSTRFAPAMADVDTFRLGNPMPILAGELDEILQKIIMIGEENGWSHDPDPS